VPSALLIAAVLVPAALAPASASATSASASATAAYARADRATVAAATRLAHCQGRAATVPARCSSLRTRLQTAGLKLSAAQSRLGITAFASSVTVQGARRKAPVLTTAGVTLKWKKIAGVGTYLLVAKATGGSDRYSVVRGTSTTPAAVAGASVAYTVRTNVTGSAWAKRRVIAYPASDGQKATVKAGTTPASPSGKTVVTKTTTTTTTTKVTTPAPAPAPAPATDITNSSGAAPAGFATGIVSGSAILYQLPFTQLLGAKHVRMEFDINTPVSQMLPIITAYAEAGIQPLVLAGFPGRTPTDAEAQNLASWAAAFGPGGTARAGKNWAASTALTDIEFGNETNQPWQYPALQNVTDWVHDPAYANIATQYAQKFKTASQAISAANPGVGLLAIADTPGRWAIWMNAIYAAVPNFHQYVAGWIVHPYGPGWQLTIDDAMSQVASHGAPSSIPIFVTEFGFATDNGRCLSDNYGWDPCMTYDSAASTLRTAVGAMRARYAKRLAAVYLYSTSDLSTTGTSTDRERYFGALHNDKSAKGAFTTEVKAQLLAGA
jgi:hypothetical protein